jgi:uncharacterized protein involved in exopolysaccharide biosynthesis
MNRQRLLRRRTWDPRSGLLSAAAPAPQNRQSVSVLRSMAQFLPVVRRFGWLLIALPLLGAFVGLALAKVTHPTYEAQTTVVVRPQAPFSPIDPDVKTLTTDEIVHTNALLMTQQPLLQQVVDELSLGISADELGREIDVAPQVHSTTLVVTVHDRDPKLAKEIADRLVSDYIQTADHVRQEQLDQYVASMQTALAQAEKVVADDQVALDSLQHDQTAAEVSRRASLQNQIQVDESNYAELNHNLVDVESQAARTVDSLIVVAPATLLTRPVSPSVQTNVAIGGFGGILVSALVALLLVPALQRPEVARVSPGRSRGLGRTVGAGWVPADEIKVGRVDPDDVAAAKKKVPAAAPEAPAAAADASDTPGVDEPFRPPSDARPWPTR